MALKYETPGVYFERVDAAGPAISAIRTDVAGFVGIAARGPVDTPVPVQSWRQFLAYFGDFTGQSFLAYCVRAFFENGGRRCWVVRVASDSPVGGHATASAILRMPPPPGSPKGAPDGAVWAVEACSPGAWGNNLTILLQETHRAQTVSIPALSTPETTVVASTAGFRRAMLVRVWQNTLPPVLKVVSAVDPAERKLAWQRPDFGGGLPYASPLELPPGYNLDAELFIDSIEYTLVVKEAGTVLAIYEGLSLVPEDTEHYGPCRLVPIFVPANLTPGQGLPTAPQPVVIRELRSSLESFPIPLQTGTGEVALAGGSDGLALLGVYDFIGEEFSPLDNDLVRQQKRRGLRVFNDVDEISIVTIPDIHVQPVIRTRTVPPPPCEPDPCLPGPSPQATSRREQTEEELPRAFTEQEILQVQAAMVQHCEDRRDRIALLDPPLAASKADALGAGAIREWRKKFESKYAALYYPWVCVAEPTTSLTRAIPPSGHVAGQYARTDFEVGVHKAPANAPLQWVQDVTAPVNDAVHGLLNSEGINAIRTLPGRGLRIFGARTLSSDPDWRYINVRRLLMMIEKAIYLSTQWAVFEPNDHLTRAKLRLSLTSFFIALWQQGALMGNGVNEAFQVKCDEDNNPPSERANGRLLAEVLVAPSKPFEFVVLRVGRTLNEFEVREVTVTRLTTA